MAYMYLTFHEREPKGNILLPIDLIRCPKEFPFFDTKRNTNYTKSLPKEEPATSELLRTL
jgi:hypothetical protein